MLYLDNSATTQIHPEVKDAMLPYLLEEYGNPSSKYYSLAENAKKAVETARDQVANLLGCKTDEIVFTSGSTEGNNMILKGIADYYGTENKHIITTKVEHPSVLETCRYLETKGFDITYLDVDRFGRIDLDNFEIIINEKPPILVSILWGNNEIGSLNPIRKIGELCQKYNIRFHTDATQVVGKVKFKFNKFDGLNFLTCSAHKFHGPKGVGVVVLKKDHLGLKAKITPLLHGGSQENGYRSGTLAVHNIVGMGKAAELANKKIDKNIDHILAIESSLINILSNKFHENIKFNNDFNDKLPGILSVQFLGINNEILVKQLAPIIAVSTGSACSSAKPSHVLLEIGLSINDVRNTIRFSCSSTTKSHDLDVLNKL
ncbi:aminotransferase class V-fold PLP-dependent enzyme [Fictibacillus nanhaiensis]|uniref:cysteine desulfurase family protein n=1 Tax=Fictibacillus nanhaiensis TaxID=742169 RepID=UPI001C948B88|nr:aminotransferase class V-fold PLP-dependent enzyme [Fictibacillus nanhaiensis]MBY6036643.1 aminotransferase class V-fold PLP-dependent enzyme [Fictibacillus nanhaiensis]